MYMERITAFTDYLANGRRSLNDVCKFLTLNTFKDFRPQAIYLGQIESDGNLVLKSSFGFDPKYISQWERIPLTFNVPVIEAIRNDQAYVFNSQEELFGQYPDIDNLGIVSRDWVSCIACPAQSLGAYFVVMNESASVCPEFNSFIKAIGNLLALQLQEMPPVFESKARTAANSSSLPTKPLTTRQELIKDLLIKGFTNPQIAAEIGFSESLIRQETIAIYAHMRVSGRVELMKVMEAQSSAKA